MDFSAVPLTEDQMRFRAEVREFLATHVTADVLRREHETGDSFDEAVHLAMGSADYLRREVLSEDGGGFDRVERRIWELERRRSRVPWVTWGTTALVARTVLAVASPSVRDEVLRRVYTGEVRICLGYTEPEGGSDVATCRTRATRDGDDWVINGSKMFTTGAHQCQYVFLLTNTDPAARKHAGLTVFLVPLDATGIEIQGVRTVDGDRTNIVYYSDVRVSDRYRIGDVNGGWAVVRGALDDEHGAVAADPDGLQDVSILDHQSGFLSTAVDGTAASVGRPNSDGRYAIDDDSVAYRLGRCVARLEVGLSTPNIFGRVAQAQAMRDVAPDLMDIRGSASALTSGASDAVDQWSTEYLYRFAPLVGIYGGTLEVFRNMIAQHVLGLSKPVYAAATGP